MKKIHVVIIFLSLCTLCLFADWRDRREVAPAFVFYYSEASGWTNVATADTTRINFCYDLPKKETYVVSIGGAEHKLQGPIEPCFNVEPGTRVRVFDPPTKK